MDTVLKFKPDSCGELAVITVSIATVHFVFVDIVPELTDQTRVAVDLPLSLLVAVKIAVSHPNALVMRTPKIKSGNVIITLSPTARGHVTLNENVNDVVDEVKGLVNLSAL